MDNKNEKQKARYDSISSKAGSPYLWITYTDANGHRRRESCKSSLMSIAKALLAKRRTEALEGVIPALRKKDMPFKDYAVIYKDWAKGQKSYITKCDRIRLLLDDEKAFGKYNLGDFTVETVEAYMSRRTAEGRKPATINRAIAVLKHMLGKAVQWDRISEEKVKKVLKVKLLKENNWRTRFLSKEECRLLLEACPAYLKPIVQTALSTGMRKDEILSLTWDRVDFTHNRIVVTLTKNGETRHVPINGALRSVLEGLAAANVDGHRYIFHDTQGRRYQDVKRGFPGACKRAGITDCTFHDLRHTFASHLVMAGVDITTVSKLLGHKGLGMTFRYSHLAPGHLSKAISVVEVLLSEKSQEVASA